MAAANGNTVGEILRKAREEKKLTIQQAHEETKISVERINALEADDYASFPSETYLKGFIKNYATFLGLDHARLWTMVGGRRATETAGMAARKAQAQAPTKAKRDTPAAPSTPTWEVESGFNEVRLRSPQLLKRVVLPILIVLIVLLAILLLRERRAEGALTLGAAPAYVGHGVITRVEGT